MNKILRGLLKLPVTFYKTLIDFKYYRALDKMRISRAIAYLAIISFLLSLIAVIPSASSVSRTTKEFFAEYEANAPDFNISDGIMTTGEGEPVFMIDEGGKALVVVFDETDAISASDLNEYQSILLLDSDSIYVRTPLADQDMPYTTIFPGDLDKETFTRYLGMVTLFNILFMGLYVVTFVLFNFAGAFFISSIGNLLLSFKKINLGFKRAYAIACYASTLPVILKTLRHLFMVNIMYFDVIYVLIGILYFWNAARQITKDRDKLSENKK